MKRINFDLNFNFPCWKFLHHIYFHSYEKHDEKFAKIPLCKVFVNTALSLLSPYSLTMTLKV